MMFSFFRNFRRPVSLFLICNILATYMPINTIMALTDGPSQPEMSGYQSADVNDNVSLSSGAFNYNIPISSIPEYPMAIGYNPGLRMDAEASCFGFGFNGFSGAINREMVGLPDDIKEGNTVYDFKNEKYWSIGGYTSAGAGVGDGDPLFQGVAGGSIGIGYSNYNGFSASAGVFTAALFNQLSFGVSSDEANSGFRYAVASPYNLLSYEANFKKYGDKASGLKAFAKDLGLGNTIERFNYPGTYSSSIPSINNVNKYNGSTGLNVSASIVGVPGAFAQVGGTFFETNNDNASITKKSIGMMHMDAYDKSNDDLITDYATEGEVYFDKNKDFVNRLNNPSYLQKDNFLVNAGGLSIGTQFVHQEYGEFSRYRARTQSRMAQVSLPTSVATLINTAVGIKTNRSEVIPWDVAEKSKINRDFSILDLLKKDDAVGAKDFDNMLFKNIKLQDLNGAEQKMESKPVLRARGDMAGDFNFSSTDYNDYTPNEYSIESTSETGDDRFFFLGYENKIPVFYPQKKVKTLSSTTPSIKSSTKIKYRTFSEISSEVSTAANSIYTHYALQDPNQISKSTIFEMEQAGTSVQTEAKKKYLSFNPLKNMIDENPSLVNNLIAEVSVKNTTGMTYLFNLPVMQKSARNLTLSGKNVVSQSIVKDLNEAPETDGSKNYRSYRKALSNTYKDRNKLTVKEDYWYPYAWLLTAIVGPDYVDFDDIVGPSDGDLGYWVKFKYVKVADDYRWRTPFNGMTHVAGYIENKGDDVYAVSTGQKEIYYLERIESKSHVSQYSYIKRLDAFEANGQGVESLWNGDAHNSSFQPTPAVSDEYLGNKSMFATKQVTVYKKRGFQGKGNDVDDITDITDASYYTKLSSTHFSYDYSTSSNVPNNINASGVNSISSNLYGGSNLVETGKLTLRKVQQFTYHNGIPIPIPPYDLEYVFDNDNDQYNPSYNPHSYDGWFSYSKNSGKTFSNIRQVSGDWKNCDFYQHYNEINKQNADENAKVFSLKKISMPSGSEISVELEAGSYSKVQNQDAFAMRKILGIMRLPDNKVELEVDISDLLGDGKNLGSKRRVTDVKNILNASDKVKGVMAFLENNKGTIDPSDYCTIEDEAVVHSLGSIDATKKSQKITLTTERAGEEAFFHRFLHYMFNESFKYNAVKKTINGFICTDNDPIQDGNCPNPTLFATLYDDKAEDPLQMLLAMLNNLKNYFQGSAKYKCLVENCFDVKPTVNESYTGFLPHLSYLRTPIYKEVYTGYRVKSISYSDGFSYSSNYDAVDGKHANTYTTNYFYDANGDGTGISEGVATVEPMGDLSCVIRPSEFVGEGFLPAPRIIYARATVENGYSKPKPDPNVTTAQVVSRKKGKQQYLFFTPNDKGLSFNENFNNSVPAQMKNVRGGIFMFGIWNWIFPFKNSKRARLRRIKFPGIPPIIPLTFLWRKSDSYATKSYAYRDVTDIYGTMKKKVSLTSDEREADSEEYIYASTNEPMNVVNAIAAGSSNPFSNNVTQGRLGRYDQTWGEAFCTKESEIQLGIQVIVPYMTARTEKHFAHTNMKYSYLPPVLKKIKSKTTEGLLTESSFDYFDFYTGQALQTSMVDSKRNTKIDRSIPAYWKYSGLGPADISENNSNMLTASTAQYQYLNSADDSHILDASVTQWANGSGAWSMSETMLPKYNTDGQFEEYKLYSSADLNAVYIDHSSSKLNFGLSKLNKHILMGNYYLPHKSFAYETDKTTEGTYTAFTSFDYGTEALNALWKKVNEITLYNPFGGAVESKDILGKYSAMHIGYDFSFNTFSAINAKKVAFVHEGGENQYVTNSSTTALEHPNLKLNNSQILHGNVPNSGHTYQTLTYNALTLYPGAYQFDVCRQNSGTALDVPLARFNATFINGEKRTLSLYLDKVGKPYFLTNRMEKFEGFYSFTVPGTGCLSTSRLVLKPTDFMSFSLDNSFSVASGYTVSTPSVKIQMPCLIPNVSYELPKPNGGVVPHTGDYCYTLESGEKGLEYTLLKSSFPSGEQSEQFQRKYTAMVWVHKSSSKTMLSMESSSNNVAVATTDNPYLVAGDWVLLRVDLDAPAGMDNQINAYVKNVAQKGISIFDDFRVVPFHASMSATVFEHAFGRVSATLDANNFASYYKYDTKGRLIETKAEIANVGVKTINKKLYNEQKSAE